MRRASRINAEYVGAAATEEQERTNEVRYDRRLVVRCHQLNAADARCGYSGQIAISY
jgi:hypothetical protein